MICNGYAQGIGLAPRGARRARAPRGSPLEDPCADDDALPLARAAGLEVVGVPVDADGVAASTRSTAPTPTPSCRTPSRNQRPTGAVRSAERRAAALRWARERRPRLGDIVEDDDDHPQYRYRPRLRSGRCRGSHRDRRRPTPAPPARRSRPACGPLGGLGRCPGSLRRRRSPRPSWARRPRLARRLEISSPSPTSWAAGNSTAACAARGPGRTAAAATRFARRATARAPVSDAPARPADRRRSPSRSPTCPPRSTRPPGRQGRRGPRDRRRPALAPYRISRRLTRPDLRLPRRSPQCAGHRRRHRELSLTSRIRALPRSSAHELMQYRSPPASRGPSLNTLPEVAAAALAHDLGADHPARTSRLVSTASATAGSVKLGQPEPESNFVSEENSSAPQPAQRYTPSSWQSQYWPVNARSVPALRSTWVLLRRQLLAPLPVGLLNLRRHTSGSPYGGRGPGCLGSGAPEWRGGAGGAGAAARCECATGGRGRRGLRWSGALRATLGASASSAGMHDNDATRDARPRTSGVRADGGWRGLRRCAGTPYRPAVEHAHGRVITLRPRLHARRCGAGRASVLPRHSQSATPGGPALSVAEDRTTLDELCVNTIRTLSMDAVQKANSGHPGTPMALAPLAYMPRHAGDGALAEQPELARSRPFRAVLRPRLDAPVLDALPDRLRAHARRPQAVPPARLADRRPPRVRPRRGDRDHHRAARARGSAPRSAWRSAERLLAARFNRDGPRDCRPLHVRDRVRRRPPGGRRVRGVVAGRSPRPRPPASASDDDNHISIEGDTALSFTEDVGKRYEAYGWHVQNLGEDIGLRPAGERAGRSPRGHRQAAA